MNKPEMIPLTVGETIKVLSVNADAGSQMPLHYSTEEAVIIVQEGEAVLGMEGKEHVLTAGTSFLIPARARHTLRILKKFKAVAVMATKSDIKFT